MSKWMSARHIALKEGETIEIDDEERVVSAEYDSPRIYLVVVKESNRRPESEECICVKFNDTAGFRIADLCCPIHGVNGTDPGDGYWEEE